MARRLIPSFQLVNLGIPPRALPGAQSLINADAYRLWRSSRHYRKCCRVLRRAGRKVGAQ